MFYSQFILAKKGPLGTIWIAAHLERKLRKNQVTETNISVSVDSILFPEVPIALRLSGHLLLGVVRIYSRKVNYLFHDCSEALTKIKQAFHSGAVDLPPDAATAPFHSITIPENFDLDELEPLPERESNALFTSSSADHHVTSREQITLRDPLGDDVYLASFDMDERFPEGDADKLGIDFEEELLDKTYERERSPVITLEEDQLAPMPEDEELDFDRMDVDANEDVPASPVVVQDRGDEDELFGHSIEMQPMLDDERLEPASLAADDDMDFEQQHQSPHTPPVLSEVGGAELAVAQDGEEGLRNPSGLPDQEMSAHGKTLNSTDTGEAQDMEDIEHEANKENEDTFGGAISSGAGMEQRDEHGRDEDGIATRDEENVAEEAEDRNPQESVVPVHEEGAEPLHGVSNEVRAANSVDGEHDNEAPETLQGLEQQLHKDDAVSTAQNVQVHDEDGDASIISPKDGQRSPDEVSEYEVVRSAVDTVEKEPDMFEMDKGSPSEMIPEQQHAAENVDEIMEDVLPVANEHDHVLEGAMVVREHSSPHLASPGNEHDVLEDNDVLAELLGGRGTPALGVVPTPLAAIAPKTVKPRVSKKRKAVFDLFDLRTVIQAEAMRDQLVNTADIRRVRKKAPCTRREFWLLQRELQANNGFHDPSVPGLCPELRDLFHRVCVFGGANLPRPGMHDMSLDKEKTLELDLGNEEIENDIYSDGYAPVPTPEENGHEESHQEAQKEISPEQPHQTANATDGKDWAESPENDTVMEDQDTMLNETVHDGPMESHRPENEAEVGAAEEVVDEDEAARQAAREAVLLEWEAFDNASLEQESLKQVEQQLEFQLQETEVSTAHADASGPVVQEADTTKEAEQLLVRSEADIETEPYFPPTQANLETQSYQQDVSQGDLFAEARANEARQEIEHSESVPDIQAGVAASVIQVIGAEVEADTVGDTSIVQETSKIDPQPEISHHEEHDMSDRGHDEGDSLQDVDDHQAQLPEIVGDVSATSPDADATSHEIPPGGSSLKNGNPITGDACMNRAIHASPEELNNREDLGFLADAQETVYRTGDDGDLEMDADEYVDTRDYNQDEPLVQDNSGWSVRTRAVGRYLKATLDAMEMKMNRVEGLPSAPAKLGLERTLVGKSRKEAARMFFETLVLKTKDYIHVEQEEPYEDIKLSAGPKLRKSTF